MLSPERSEGTDSVVKHLSTTVQNVDSEASPRQGERSVSLHTLREAAKRLQNDKFIL
ncbi:MAG: hypothetical protein HC862_06185 [Scytonema sp. RU_4_4]|nr:hypothetical protein [Scytonema sp. RU_4_4]NJR73923.1 hypothetical protein [Scytonema sp. CRU_2_7]